MTRGSELMLYLLFGLPVALVLLVLLFVGPLGWFTAAFLGIGVTALVSLLDPSDDQTAPRRVNCPNCGSPNAPDRDACHYCEEPT